MIDSDLTLFDEAPTPEISQGRVRAIAGVLAGFRWPGRGGFEKLKLDQQNAALRVARRALENMENEE